MQQTTPSTLSSRALLVTLSTPFFLGAAPVLGKLALIQGVDAFSVAALRTIIAVVLLWVIYLVNYRRYLYIYPAGLIGCIAIGVINGISSLFYYGGLSYVDASLAQLLNGMYLIFALLLARLGGQRFDQRTLFRIGLAIVALVLLTGVGGSNVNWFGVTLMLINALLFAATMILSQGVLYEMPAQTATLYILTTMAAVVTVAWLIVGDMPSAESFNHALLPLIALAFTTMLSRLAMFTGVKAIGGLQTAIIAVMEIGVSLVLAFVVLGDRLTLIQAVGVALLLWCLLLIRPKDLQALRLNPKTLLPPSTYGLPLKPQSRDVSADRAGQEEADRVSSKPPSKPDRPMQFSEQIERID
jgi:drug/metabolite transporter (DMT)-like permease